MSVDNRTEVLYNRLMHVQIQPDILTRLSQMGDVTTYEPAGDQPGSERHRVPYQSHSLSECITNVTTPKGSKPILKTLLTTACERNCNYCPFRAGRSKTKRVTFSPDEMAKGFDALQQKGQVDGLFLSSGIIKGGIATQDRIIDTVNIIRQRYHYHGYVHLKIMPGAQYEQVYRAMQLADRISVNLEGPTQERLNALAPKKDFFHELLAMLQLSNQIRRDHPGEKLANTVTQFVVGAVQDTDHELLSLSDHLYRDLGLTRAYYSSFSPVIQTPFENIAPTNPLREHRLYQASFLLRNYGWQVEELPFADNDNLLTDKDPKRAWADTHLREAPIDLMTAAHQQLLRIPGIGPVAAAAIIKARCKGHLTDLSHLRQLHIAAPEQIAPYILLDGHKPTMQLALF